MRRTIYKYGRDKLLFLYYIHYNGPKKYVGVLFLLVVYIFKNIFIDFSINVKTTTVVFTYCIQARKLLSKILWLGNFGLQKLSTFEKPENHIFFALSINLLYCLNSISDCSIVSSLILVVDSQQILLLDFELSFVSHDDHCD